MDVLTFRRRRVDGDGAPRLSASCPSDAAGADAPASLAAAHRRARVAVPDVAAARSPVAAHPQGRGCAQPKASRLRQRIRGSALIAALRGIVCTSAHVIRFPSQPSPRPRPSVGACLLRFCRRRVTGCGVDRVRRGLPCAAAD
eukprot:6202082-Pleurochrysis_carterae.AAC.2